jgi:two-component system, OmpR family, alkaline phosphatase synthesis response regulator PhoP
MGTAMKFKILFVEDEVSLQKSIAYILEKEGFSVITTRTGEEAVRLASKEKPDLLLLDLMLPGIDGFRVCEILKRDPQTARIFIIMLTGKGLVTDITRGLAQYADDYITKPFEPEILIARIHAVLRRKLKSDDVANDNVASDILKFDRLTLDLNAHELRIDGEIVDLTKTEFDMLVLLARKPNIVFSRAQVLDYIREDNYDVTERIVDYQVSGLRKKLSKGGHFIETVRGVGYKFRV